MPTPPALPPGKTTGGGGSPEALIAQSLTAQQNQMASLNKQVRRIQWKTYSTFSQMPQIKDIRNEKRGKGLEEYARKGNAKRSHNCRKLYSLNNQVPIKN